MIKGKKVRVIIVAAGSGSRMSKNINKQFLEVGGYPIITRTLNAFEKNSLVDEIVISTKEDEKDYFRENILQKNNYKKIIGLVSGGKERQDSVINAYEAIKDDSSIILVHDGARPFVSQEIINNVIIKTEEFGAAAPLIPMKDSLKYVENNLVKDTVDRDKVFGIQTPQGFKGDILNRGFSVAKDLGIKGTDETFLMEKIGQKVIMILGDEKNIKITTPSDLEYGNFLAMNEETNKCENLIKKEVENKSLKECKLENIYPDIRTGIGYDVHRLIEGRKLILGGVEIEHTKGLLGHSDADVLIHAIMDSILGACGMYDIGRHFPDTDDKYKGISSVLLLNDVADIVKKNGFRILNIDATIVAQKPKVASYIDRMRENISQSLEIDVSRVNIKATTTEKLGFEGNEEGISSNSIATVISISGHTPS